jgi:zinc transport system substrate-binding protein
MPFRRLQPVLVAFACAAAPSRAAPLVAADIPPVHSIVARVMAGAAEPEPIVPPGASPHGYAMRPSEARRLQQADVVVWIGPDLTPWLERPVANLAERAAVVTLMEAEGVDLLAVREHDGVHDHDHGHEHGGAGAADPHVWLDPRNGAAMARAVARALGEADPDNGELYAANAEAFVAEMAALEREIAEWLEAAGDAGFLVFHDAYQYFEARFGLESAAAVAPVDGVDPAAGRVAAIRAAVEAGGIACVFAEPQFEPALLETIAEGTSVRTAVLDPLGAGLKPGPELYPALLQNMAEQLAECLAAG